MKKRTLMIIALIATTFLSAQAQMQGNMYVGGQIGFNTNALSAKITYSDDLALTGRLPGSTAFSVAPEVGYFVIDNLRVSFAIGYSFTKQQTEEVDHKWLSTRINAVSFGPSISYYVPLIEDLLYYTPEIGFYGGFGTYKEDITLSTYKKINLSAFDMRINLLALELTINQNFSAFASIGAFEFATVQTHSKDEEVHAINGTAVNFSILDSVQAGVRYYF